jgi:TPR repeat protein
MKRQTFAFGDAPAPRGVCLVEMSARSLHILHALLAGGLLLAASLACGHAPAESQAKAPDREHEMINLCQDFKESTDEYWCLRLARSYAKGDAEAHVARDLPRAVALYDHFCDLRHDGVACLLAGSYRARGEAAGDADAWFAKACRAGVTESATYFDKADVDPSPCTKAAKADPAATDLHRLGCTRRETDSCVAYGAELLAAGRREDAVKVYGDVCFMEKRVDACVAAASADTSEISSYLRNACELGDAASCTTLHAKENAKADEARRRFAEAEKENEKAYREAQRRAPAANASSSDSSTTTVTMQSANVNGLSVTNLSCTGVSGGLLGGTFVVTAALGERASALRACGAHGTIHVTWSTSGGAIDAVTAAPTNACVVSAFRASKLTMAKRCAADLAL